MFNFLMCQLRCQKYLSPVSSRIIHTLLTKDLPLSPKKDENEITFHHENTDKIAANFRSIDGTRFRKKNFAIDKLPTCNNPDVFGTLSKDSLLRKRLEALSEEDDVEVEEFIDDQQEKTRLRTVEYAKIIKKLVIEKKLLEALEILDTRMKKEKAKPNDYIYRLLISGCAEHGYTKKAFQLFNQMKKRAIVVKERVYTSLFEACANSPWQEDGIKRAAGLWDLMIEKKVVLNHPIAHAAIKAFGRSGDIDRAFSIVDEMTSRGLSITSETISFLLQACASDKKTGFRHALMVWRKLLEKNIKPTTYTYNLLLRCTRDCSIGDINKFNEDLSHILSTSQQQKPLELDNANKKNSQHYTKSVIDNNLIQKEVDRKNLPSLLSNPPQMGSVIGIRKISKPWHRLTLLGGQEAFIDMMLKTGAKPDIKTFTQLLFAIPPDKTKEKELMERMEEVGVKKDLDFCNMLIKKRNFYNDFAGAKEVLNIISEERLTPDIITFGVLALGCINLKEIKLLVRDMKSLNLRLNIEIMGALLNSACRSWNFEAITYLVRLLVKMEIKPNYMFIKHLNNFHQKILNQIEMKKQGKGYFVILDNTNFEKDLKDLENIINHVKTLEIADPQNVHPWQQFRKLNN